MCVLCYFSVNQMEKLRKVELKTGHLYEEKGRT